MDSIEKKHKKKKNSTKKGNSIEQFTQITHRDMNELKGDTIGNTESQTDIRTDTKESQTDAELITAPLSEASRSLSNQSSMDEDPNAAPAPVDRNKLGNA